MHNLLEGLQGDAIPKLFGHYAPGSCLEAIALEDCGRHVATSNIMDENDLHALMTRRILSIQFLSRIL